MGRAEKKDDDGYLLCMPVKGATGIVVGSLKKRCGTCQCQIFVSPASWGVVQQRGLKLICIPCGRKQAAAEGDGLNVELPTPEQQAEIRQKLRRELPPEIWAQLQMSLREELLKDDWNEIRTITEQGFSEAQRREIQEALRQKKV